MAAITSAGSGLWSVPSTWVGLIVPGAADTVTIATGHTVTVDGAYTVGGDVANGLLINGTLKASRLVPSTLTLRTTPTHGTAGTLDYGTVADPIPAAITATIVINDSAAMVSRKYRLLFGSGQFGGFYMRGASKTHLTRVTTATTAAATTITVDDATGWRAGDVVCVDSTSTSITGFTYRAIVSLTGNTVVIGAATGEVWPAGLRIVNLTRNVRIVGSGAATYQSAVTIAMAGTQPVGTVAIGWCEVVGLGGGSASGATPDFAALNLYSGALTSSTRVFADAPGVSLHDVVSVSGAAATLCPAGAGALLLVSSVQGYYPLFASLAASSGRARPLWHSTGNASAEFTDIGLISAQTLHFNGYTITGKWTGGYVSCITAPLINYTINVSLTGVSFGSMTGYEVAGTGVRPSVKFSGCTFEREPVAVAVVSAASAVGCTFEDCVFPSLPVSITAAGSGLASVLPESVWTLRNANGATGQYRYSSAGLSLRDNAVMYRGTSSLQMQPWFSGAPLTFTRRVSAQGGQTVAIRAYVRRNAAFGTGDVTLTLSGLGIAPVVATAPTAADTWHLVTLSATNPGGSLGEFVLTATATSTGGATAQCWIDGVTIADYVPSVRHYGYLWDGLPNVTSDARITLTESAALALPVVIDHGAHTITITGTLTARQVFEACVADLCQTSNQSQPVHITSGTGADFSTTYTVAGNVNGVYTDATGTHVQIIAPGIVPGARVQVYSVTDDAELYNAVISTSGLVLPYTWSADKTLRIRAAKLGYLPFEASSNVTATGMTVLDAMQGDAVYSSNGINGATVSEFTADLPNLQVDSAGGLTTVQRLYAWMRYFDTLAGGIGTDQFGGIAASDALNYTIGELQLDNTGTGVLMVGGGYLVRRDGTTVIYPGGGSIQMDPGKAYIPQGLLPTPAQIADGVLDRNLAGGSDGGRTVRDALRVSRNRVELVGAGMIVYREDDTTPAWTADVTTGQRDPLMGVNPA